MASNPFEAELQKREAEELSSASVFSAQAGRRFANNMLGIPSAVGEIASIPLSGASAAIEGGTAALTGGDFDFVRRYRQNQTEFPAVALRNIPRPTVQGIDATLQSASAAFPGGENPIAAGVLRMNANQQADEAVRAAHPVATGAGDVAGDIASLWGMRAPFLSRIANVEQKILPKFDVYFGGAKTAMAAEPGLARAADRVVKSPTIRRLGRGVFRSGETGFEAAVLDAMQGNDPLANAGFAAGAQMVGSGSLYPVQGLMSGGPMKAGVKLSLAAAGVMGLTQVLKESTPGGRDRILESAETGFAKVALTLGLGAASAMMGAGRLRGTAISEDFPRIIDGIATIPRGAALSVLTRWNDGDENTRADIERALNGMAQNPDYKPQSETERFVIDAFQSVNPFAEELGRRATEE